MIRSACYLAVLTTLCAAFAYAAGGLTRPIVFNVTPDTGPPVGGTTLTIIGENFGTTSTPLIGGRPLLHPRLLNNTTMTGITPPAGGANVPIVVTGGDGSVSDPFFGFSFDKPIIFNVTPMSGSAFRDTTITVIGKNFGESGNLFVGKNRVNVFNYTDVRVFGKVQPGVGRDLPIRIHDGFGQFSGPFIGFSYRRPSILSVLPSNGTRLGGTQITIVGTDFGSIGNVTIGARPAPIVNYADTEIVALTPPGSTDTPDIMVIPSQGEPSDAFTGQWRYQPCPAGYFDPQNSGECRPCRPGTFSPLEGAEFCTPCPRGQVQPDPGATECLPCQPGRFQNQTGQTTCEECEVGTFAPTDGSPLCQPCVQGTFQPTTGARTCELCPPGTAQGREGQVECEPCLVGTFAPDKGNQNCRPCARGFVQPAEGQAFCDACLQGTFQPDEGRTLCMECEAGTFAPLEGQTECLPCPLGSYQPEPGGTSCLNCDEAPPNLQVDFDGDGLIDICDPDSDDDGVPDKRDRCVFTPLDAAVDPSGGSLGDTDQDCDTDLEDIRDTTLGFTGPLLFAVDCVVADFGPFSDCSVVCGGGIRCRTRQVLQEPMYGGEPCPALEECVSCNQAPCPVDCVVSPWSDFSSCSAPCGGGIQCRTRQVLQEPMFGGLACPTLQDCRPCNTDPCP